MDHLFKCLVDFLFSSSPIDRRLSRDLVVVSHWEAGHKPSTSPKNNAPWRNKAPKNKSGKSLTDLQIIHSSNMLVFMFSLIFSILQRNQKLMGI